MMDLFALKNISECVFFFYFVGEIVVEKLWLS